MTCAQREGLARPVPRWGPKPTCGEAHCCLAGASAPGCVVHTGLEARKGHPTGLSGAAPSARCSGEAPGATDGARRAPEAIAVAVGGVPPGPEGQLDVPQTASRGPRAPAPRVACSRCARAPHVMTWGPQMTCLAAWPAGLGASTLAPHARHRTVTKAAVGLGGDLRPAARRARGHSPIYRPPGLLGAPTAASRGRTHTRRQPTGRPAARAPVARCARRA